MNQPLVPNWIDNTNQRINMSKKLINPKELFDSTGSGYSQAVIDTETGLVFISGQVDWNQQHEVTEKSIEGQVRRALSNLEVVLEAAGSSVDRLLQVRAYVRGEISEHMSTIAPILAEFLGESRPALTGIGVASLASPEILVEIEAVARVK
jgi:2-iminobutanoate/2-iminopropanoate deaminase